MRLSKVINRSIIARISTYMLLVYLMAMVSILASFTIAERTRGDAAALNIAGSLRMQTYRILNTLHALTFDQQKDPVQLQEQLILTVESFTERFNQPDLINAIPKSTDQRLIDQYQKIGERWFGQIKPSLLQVNTINQTVFYEYESTLESFFVDIDQMVSILEQNTENKIRLLLFLQFSCLAFAIVIILVSIGDLRKKIVQPLKRLMFLANEASHHNFTTRSGLKGDDEFAALGHTFDEMATQLSASYANLEARVQKKTLELERSHAALQLLHDASHHLYEHGGDLCRGAVPILKEVENLLDIGPTSIYLASDDSQQITHLMTTQAITRPAYCRNFSCNACITSKADDLSTNSARTGTESLIIPIFAGKQKLGTIETYFPKGRILSDRALKLLSTLADQIGTAIFLHNKSLEKQKISLLEERTVIARELHDSLAQSLSYLKIQVSCLQKIQKKEQVSEDQELIISEIRTGLNDAYAHLRELLTTFRLQLNQPSLKEALDETVKEFSERMSAEINFNISIPHDLLSPNEEVHILQITREALSNAHKHAKATMIDVSLSFVKTKVMLIIKDNGVGLKDGKIPENHYGLIIMRDRSMTLGGEIIIENQDQGGVQLTMSFTPTSVNTTPSKIIFPSPDTTQDA